LHTVFTGTLVTHFRSYTKIQAYSISNNGPSTTTITRLTNNLADTVPEKNIHSFIHTLSLWLLYNIIN